MTIYVTDRVKRRRWRLALAPLAAVALLSGGAGARPATGPPAPRAVLGFEPGDDYQLADFGQLRTYFRRLDEASDRVQLMVAGHSAGGREMLVAAISSPANLARLDEYRRIARRLALARDPAPDLARSLARDGKAIVWIDNGLHASEVATSQHAIRLAHHLATSEDRDARHIRENVIVVLLPCVNPDGMEMVVSWYRRHRGTPHQDSPLPWIQHPFTGHDNNRDFFMQTQPETELLNRLLYREWLPQLMYNQHQGIWPARMFVPPFPEPVNPHIDAQVMEGVEAAGRAIKRRLSAEGRDGVISRYAFSAWYNGSIRTASYFHNMIGILTEVSHASATPHWYDPGSIPDMFPNGVSARVPSDTYPRPWLGGHLRLRDAVSYMTSASLAVLEHAAQRREELLLGIYEMGRRQIALGATESPIAYIVPTAQHDPPVAAAFLDVLTKGGIDVHRAVRPFTADGVSYPAGTHVILLAQPFRPFVRDLVEPQHYPDMRDNAGRPMPPYDAAGWTLAYQMGVDVLRVARPFDTAGLSPVFARPAPPPQLEPSPGLHSWGHLLDPRANASFTAVNQLLAAGIPVERLTAPFSPQRDVQVPAGAWLVRPLKGEARQEDAAVAVDVLVREHGLRAWVLETAPDVPSVAVRPARLGVYRSWVANIDEGWTRWILEQHGFLYESLSDRDVRRGRLRDRLDVIIMPAQDEARIVRGHQPTDRPAVPGPWGPVPPEYQSGVGEEGVEALREFVEAGGTLIAFDAATDLVLSRFGGVFSTISNTTAALPRETFFCPGSVVRISVERGHPAAWGMAAEAAAFFQHSRAFAARPPARTLARYGSPGRILMSGWLLGEEYVANQPAAVDVPFGRGHVVLFGFRPHFRAQSQGTFKLLFNLLLRHGAAGARTHTADAGVAAPGDAPAACCLASRRSSAPAAARDSDPLRNAGRP